MPLPPVTSGLCFWFDARDIIGVSDGSTISSWADTSGNSRNASVASGTATYHTNQYQGGAAITFSGCQMNISGTGTITTTDNHTGFAIVRLVSVANGFIIGQQSLGHFLWGVDATVGGSPRLQYLHQDFIGPSRSGTAAPDTSWHQMVAQQSSNVSVGFNLDSATDPTVTGTGGLANNNPPDAIGGNTGADFISAQIQVIGYWNRVLTGTEIAQLWTTPPVVIAQPRIFVVT